MCMGEHTWIIESENLKGLWHVWFSYHFNVVLITLYLLLKYLNSYLISISTLTHSKICLGTNFLSQKLNSNSNIWGPWVRLFQLTSFLIRMTLH